MMLGQETDVLVAEPFVRLIAIDTLLTPSTFFA